MESQYAATHSRFSASSAYFELVDRRIQDIAESRLAGMQTIREFMDRRLTPARSTCEWATRRQDALSQRVSRMSNLLRTRVEIEQQQSSRALLTTMNQRQDLQLQSCSPVESLSVAPSPTTSWAGELPGQGRAKAGLAPVARDHGGRGDSGGGGGRVYRCGGCTTGLQH